MDEFIGRRVGDEVIKGINLYVHVLLFKIPLYTILQMEKVKRSF